MRSVMRASLVLFVGAILAACSAGSDASDTDSSAAELGTIPNHPHSPLCAREMRPGFASCHAHVRTDAQGHAVSLAAPQGLTPANLVDAYKLPAGGGVGATIAIIDSNDDPKAESDLAVYRAQFGLPPCTTANGCFKKVNQRGVQGSYPAADAGWAGEISLDVDMASAVCPNCKILLVEADSATTANLGAAVNMAAAMGATVISNSYGGPEDSSITAASTKYYNHPGIAITASTGDNGFGVSFPASSPFVTAVGGTSLKASATSARGWVEGAWNGAGSGCSTIVAKPSWQTDTGCAKRTVGDVSAVADPNTGVAVYDTYGAGNTGWQVYGGTSASAPIVAGIYALTGHGGVDGSYSYENKASFFDATTGSNGSCGGTYLCTAKVGYDGPTGNGTPDGALLSGGTPPPPPPVDAGSPPPPPVDAGGGTSTCSHAVCSTGTKLTKTCDSCATQICAVDAYCCRNKWDAQCVGEVNSICGETCQ